MQWGALGSFLGRKIRGRRRRREEEAGGTISYERVLGTLGIPL